MIIEKAEYPINMTVCNRCPLAVSINPYRFLKQKKLIQVIKPGYVPQITDWIHIKDHLPLFYKRKHNTKSGFTLPGAMVRIK